MGAFLNDFIKFIEKHDLVKSIEKEAELTSFDYLNNAKELGKSIKQPLEAEDFIIEFNTAGTLSFTEIEKEEAKSFFQRINYYRFSIFPKLLPKNRKYSFSDALALSHFDEYLRNELGFFTSIIENNLKGSIVYSLVHNYDSEDFFPSQCYMDLSIYHSEEWGRSILEVFSNQIKISKNPAIFHHKDKHNACFPIWVIFEEITFGTLDTFISQLDATYKTPWISKYYNPKYKSSMVGWIGSLRVLRNKIAHHSRLYGSINTSPPGNLKKDKRIFKNITHRGKTIERRQTLFGSFYVLKNLLAYGSPQDIKKWNDFLSSLQEEINLHSNIIELEFLGFPEDWNALFKIS